MRSTRRLAKSRSRGREGRGRIDVVEGVEEEDARDGDRPQRVHEGEPGIAGRRLDRRFVRALVGPGRHPILR
jgi:hypothetical protein